MADQTPFAPLVEAGPTEQVPQQAFIDRVAKLNAANDPHVKDYCTSYVWDAVRESKQRRSSLEEEWLAIQRMTVLAHDEGRKYIGRSEAYLPLYARIRKTLVSQITKSLFPSDEYMDVTDREQGDTEQAKACKEVLRYEFDCAAQLRRFIKPFVGQFCDIGIAPLKVWYRTNRVFQGKRALINTLAEYPDEGLTVSARSMFNVVVYPEWAEEDRDLRIVAERLEIPVSFAQRMMNTGRWLNVPEVLATSGSDDFDWTNQRSLADIAGIPSTSYIRDQHGAPTQSVIAIEAWCDVKLPPMHYTEGEDKTLPIPCRVLFINGIPVSVTRNPFYHQRTPFLFARDNIIAGSFYSNGAGRMVRNLQYLCNDFANQTNDVGIYGLNPITIINTAYFAGPPGPLKPGGVLKTRDINEALRFESPKAELVQHGMPLLSMLISFANDGGGAPPVSQGTKAASTATGTQILSANASGPVQDSVEDIEAQVMVPLMKMAWALSQQYRDKELIRRIVDPNGVDGPASIIPADIDIDPEFRFLSSSQASNRQQRTSQIQAFLQLAGALAPQLQMQGLGLDAKAVLQRFWNDALGFRGFNNIVKPLTLMQQQAMANGGPPPGMPGQPGVPPVPGQPEPGEPPAAEGGSAVPQGGLPGAGEMVPGEGEEIQDVYSNGQDMAASAGLGGGVY